MTSSFTGPSVQPLVTETLSDGINFLLQVLSRELATYADGSFLSLAFCILLVSHQLAQFAPGLTLWR